MHPRQAELVALLRQWLHELGRAGTVEVTPRAMLRVQAIVQRGVARDLGELRTSLVAVLARDEASAKLIGTSFDGWHAEIAAWASEHEEADDGRETGAGVGTDGVDAGPRGNATSLGRLRRPIRNEGSRWTRWFERLSWRRWVVVLASVAGLALATPLLVSWVGTQIDRVIDPWSGSSELPTAVDSDELPPAVWPLEPTRTVPTTQPPAAAGPTPAPGPWWVLLVLGLGSLLLASLGLRWWRAVDVLRRDLEDLHAQAEAEREDLHRQGTRVAVPYHVEVPLPLPAGDIDGAATELSRMSEDHPGWELDVEPTVRRTIDDGGRVRPVFQPARQYGGLVVLVDVETAGHPELHRVERLLERWTRDGLRFHRYDFEYRPSRLVPHEHGEAIELPALAQRHGGAPLLVLSRGARPGDRFDRLPWLPGLRAWPNRAWIDLDARLPDEHPARTRRHRERIAASGLLRFPFTGEGVVACARTLAAGGRHAAPVQEERLPSTAELRPHLEAWAACACLVPDPSWAQLQAIRRNLPELSGPLPDARYVHRLIEWMRQWAKEARLGDVDAIGFGPKLDLPPNQLDALRVRLIERDRGIEHAEDQLEVKAWRQLQAQLAAADVSDDPLGGQMRDLKHDVIEAILDPSQADALVERWAGSAVEDELMMMLRPERTLQRNRGLRLWRERRWTTRAWERVETLMGERRAVRLQDLRPTLPSWTPREWTWSGAGARLGLALIVAVACGYRWWWAWDPPKQAEGDAPEVVAVIPATYEVRRPEDEAVARLRRPCEDEVALADVAPMQMKCVQGGRFTMGSPIDEDGRDDDEGPQHIAEVGTLLVGVTEVTQAQWGAVMDTERFDCDYGCGPKLPAQNLSWNDAAAFMNALTERENRSRSGPPLMTCYERDGDSWRWVNRACTGFRLPTETEWEYLARAGTETAYSFGGDAKDFCRYGNGADQTAKQNNPGWTVLDCDDGEAGLAKVGRYEPNSRGLFDVHGNVWEWVWDWFKEPYPDRITEEGYAGPESGDFRVLRGGSFWYYPQVLRSAYRSRDRPGLRSPNFGVRCVRSVPPELSTP